MSTIKGARLACGCTLVLTALVAVAVALKPGTVAYHLQRLERLRQGIGWKPQPDRTGSALDRLRPEIWR